jgi:hypothetical protein
MDFVHFSKLSSIFEVNSPFKLKKTGFQPQSKELVRGPPELVQHFVHIGAVALHDLN